MMYIHNKNQAKKKKVSQTTTTTATAQIDAELQSQFDYSFPSQLRHKAQQRSQLIIEIYSPFKFLSKNFALARHVDFYRGVISVLHCYFPLSGACAVTNGVCCRAGKNLLMSRKRGSAGERREGGGHRRPSHRLRRRLLTHAGVVTSLPALHALLCNTKQLIKSIMMPPHPDADVAQLLRLILKGKCKTCAHCKFKGSMCGLVITHGWHVIRSQLQNPCWHATKLSRNR